MKEQEERLLFGAETSPPSEVHESSEENFFLLVWLEIAEAKEEQESDDPKG